MNARDNTILVTAIITTLLAILAFFGIRQFTDLLAIPTINNFKLGKSEGIDTEARTFAPKESIFAVANVSNISGDSEVKGRMYIDEVAGQESGKMILEKALEMSMDGSVRYKFSPPPEGWPKGRYKIEVVLIDSNDQQKDRKVAKVNVADNN